MIVYDQDCNMINEKAKAFCEKLAKDTDSLVRELFTDGMTQIEARVLISKLKSELEIAAMLRIMEHQMSEVGFPVPVSIYGSYPACLEENCSYKYECANHHTAGDFRTEDGLTPLLKMIDAKWTCTKKPTSTGMGAVLYDGTFAKKDWYD